MSGRTLHLVRSAVEPSLSADERRVLDRFVALVEARYGPELHGVWLFGSRARGEPPRPGSDVDVLVLTRPGRRPEIEWNAVFDLLFAAADAENADPVAFAPKHYDTDWLADRRAIESFFIQEVDRDKVVLAGRG